MKISANIKLFFVALALAFGYNATAANPNVVVSIFQEISANIKTANIEKLTEHFDSSVEMLLPDVEKTYPAAQASELLKKFFDGHKPNSYSTLHVGGKNDKHYGIGLLVTANGRFRTTIFLQVNGKDYTIQQLRIENDD